MSTKNPISVEDLTRNILDSTVDIDDTLQKYDDEIASLLGSIDRNQLANSDNPDVKKLKESLLEIKQKLAPFGRTIEGKRRYLCASIINVRDEYQTRFLLTGMIGYLRRALDEWRVPENVPAVPVYDYFKDPNILTPPKMADGRQGDPAIEAAYNESRAFMQQRMIVMQFLEDTFVFNPDEHVRSAYQPNPTDPERPPIGTPAAQLAVYHRRCELQRKKKKDLAAIRKADTMVEYIDRVLYAAEDEDYKNKLIEIRKERLAELEKAQAELNRRMNQRTIVDEKKLIGRDGTEKNVRTEREMTQEEKDDNFKKQQELCVLLGRFSGDITTIDERIRRIDEWWDSKKHAQLEEEKKQKQEQEQRQSDNQEQEQKVEMIEIDGVMIPKQPDDVMAKINEFKKRYANTSNDANDMKSGDVEIDQNDITRDTKPVPIAESEAKPMQLVQKVVVPTSHVLPDPVDAIKAEVNNIVNGESMEKTGKDSRLTSTVTNFIPPADIFNKINRYLSQNFEELRRSVTLLYGMKPDIEFAVNPFDVFDNEDDATDFTYKHRNDVITDIVTLTTNVWNVMGSFKKNRERMKFYNENTSVLEAMADEVKRNAVIGKEIMDNKRRRKRRENKAQDGGGGNDEKFKEYQKMHAPGAQTEDDIDDPDMPDDTVAVPIIKISQGGRNVEVTKMYTKAEAPVHMIGAKDAVTTKATVVHGTQ